MRNRFYKFFVFMGAVALLGTSCKVEKDVMVVIQTPYGKMKAILYEETPLHKKNFIELVKAGRYDSTIFHRVIKEFMIQGGDINMKPGVKQRVDYTIPPEFNEKFFHKRGALSAARMSDNVNPKKESNGCQFYIVHGKKYEAFELEDLASNANQQALQNHFGRLLQLPQFAELRSRVIRLQNAGNLDSIFSLIESHKPMAEERFGKLTDKSYSEIQQKTYAEVGGAPFLDADYTVFGQVVEGLEVIDFIANVQTGGMDRPLEDVLITITLEEVSKEDITEDYGYVYPVVEEAGKSSRL